MDNMRTSSRPRRLGRLPRVASAFVLALLAPTAQSRAADEPSLVAVARGCVVRFDVQRNRDLNRKDQHGSGVLIALDPPGEGGSRRATFVSAYHVLNLAESFNLFAADGSEIQFDRNKTTCYVDRSRELAFVRVVILAGEKGPTLKLIAPDPPPAADTPEGGPPRGMVFGYAEEDPTRMQALRVELQSEATASRLDLRRPGIAFDISNGQIDPNRMIFRTLGGQATLPGMSGGLALDADGHLVGLLYGRRRDRYNLLIPAFHLSAAWKAIGQAEGQPWSAFGPDQFLKPVLYRGDDDTDQAAVVDRIDWSTLDGLKALLGDDPAHEIERFEEITITPRFVGPEAPPLRIYVGPDSIPDRRQDLQIWHDGEKIGWDRERGMALVPIAKKPGESLLTILKTSGRVNDLELGGLLLPSTVDLEFSQGDSSVPFRRIVRSLPVITQTYPLFITIRTPPGPEPRGPAEGVRIAVRIDYLEELLNRVPFEIQVVDGQGDRQDSTRSAEIDGAFRLGTKGGWRLSMVSPQRLKVELSGDVWLNKARYRDFTLSTHRAPGEPPDTPTAFTVRGLLQFPRVMPQVDPGGSGVGLGLSARAIGTRGTGEWRIDLGGGHDVSFDAGGIIRHMFTCYVNKRLIAADQPHLVNESLVRPFFSALGLDGPAGSHPRVLRVGFLRDDASDPKDWMVVLCDFGRVAGASAGEPIGFGPAPSSKDGLVFEVRAGGVPGNLVQRFPNLKPGFPGANELLKEVKVPKLRVAFRLDGKPAMWFPVADPAQVPQILNKDGGEDVARRIFELFRASTARGKVVLEGELTR